MYSRQMVHSYNELSRSMGDRESVVSAIEQGGGGGGNVGYAYASTSSSLHALSRTRSGSKQRSMESYATKGNGNDEYKCDNMLMMTRYDKTMMITMKSCLHDYYLFRSSAR